MAKTSTKIFVLEVDYRHAVDCGLALADRGIPVVTLFPEVEFNKEAFLAAVQEKVASLLFDCRF